MKAKVLHTFRDKHTNKVHKVGDIITVKRERFDEILTVGQLVEEYKEEKSEKTAEKE